MGSQLQRLTWLLLPPAGLAPECIGPEFERAAVASAAGHTAAELAPAGSRSVSRRPEAAHIESEAGLGCIGFGPAERNAGAVVVDSLAFHLGWGNLRIEAGPSQSWRIGIGEFETPFDYENN